MKNIKKPFFTPWILFFCMLIFDHLVESLIDNATPAGQYETQPFSEIKKNLVYKLVMSDEFEVEGRSFDLDSNDSTWTAIHKPDGTNQADEFYDPKHVTTVDGKLQILTTTDKVSWTEWDDNMGQFTTYTKNYTSGMVMSWNKFCFQGGVLEVSVQLPGDGRSGTFWPAAWLLGNLARATYSSSTDYVWPWSLNTCTAESAASQKFSACRENSNNVRDEMNPYQGRGSPEIDIFEGMPGIEGMGHFDFPSFVSTSLQISPAIKYHHPINLKPLNSSQVWYTARHGNNTKPNTEFYSATAGFLDKHEAHNTPRHGYVADGVSGITNIDNDLFSSQHVFRIEWEPGEGGYVDWYLDGEFLWGVDDAELKAKSGAVIPEEPMYLIFNTALSDSWAMPEPCDMSTCYACYRCYDCMNPDCWCALPDGMKGCKNFPGRFLIDFVRVYQNPLNPKHVVGCDTKEFPTAAYIRNHPKLFEEWKPDTRGPYLGLTRGVFFTMMLISVLFITLVAAGVLTYKSRHQQRYVKLNTGVGKEGIEFAGDGEKASGLVQ